MSNQPLITEDNRGNGADILLVWAVKLSTPMMSEPEVALKVILHTAQGYRHFYHDTPNALRENFHEDLSSLITSAVEQARANYIAAAEDYYDSAHLAVASIAFGDDNMPLPSTGVSYEVTATGTDESALQPDGHLTSNLIPTVNQSNESEEAEQPREGEETGIEAHPDGSIGSKDEGHK